MGVFVTTLHVALSILGTPGIRHFYGAHPQPNCKFQAPPSAAKYDAIRRGASGNLPVGAEFSPVYEGIVGIAARLIA